MNGVQAQRYREMANLSDDDIEEVSRAAKSSGKPAAKADFRRRAAAKREPYAPVVPPKPSHLTQMALWLRNGAGIVPQFLDHREALSLASRHGIEFDPEQVRLVVEFLASLLAGLEADRAD